VSIVPSPQSTFVVAIVPSGSEDVIVSVTVWPVDAVLDEAWIDATGGLSDTLIWLEYEPTEPLLSVALTVIVTFMDGEEPVET